MPLSRHFYSIDEVQASLQYTTSQNKPNEALFWSQELILSGYVTEAISTLFQSWLWNKGPMRLQWLINAWNTLASDELSENDILLSTYQLATINHTYSDNSIWNILILSIQNPNEMPDRVTRKTPFVTPSHDEKELYFVRAMFQGKARSAWWISQFINNDRLWYILRWFAKNVNTKYNTEYTICLDALQNYEKLLGYKSDEYDIITRCAAILATCIKPEIQDKSFISLVSEIDNQNKNELHNLSLLIGYKNRRVYIIPRECLYAQTHRGKSKWSQNNFIQLNNIEKYLIGCPYWDEILMDYANINSKNEVEWHSTDKMEEFYEKYFPDDIPDEWTKNDKLKSHGDGLLGPAEIPNIAKYSRLFMSKIPRLAWNTSKMVNNYLEKINIYDCNVESIIKMYKPNDIMPENILQKLIPVCKTKIVST
jgi:hypothetical protein